MKCNAQIRIGCATLTTYGQFIQTWDRIVRQEVATPTGREYYLPAVILQQTTMHVSLVPVQSPTYEAVVAASRE